VHRGEVRLVLRNTSRPDNGPPHDLQFSGLPFYIGTVQAGAEASVTFTAPAPGTYGFVCTIHANQNQTGKLVVR
jgi:plastocyanin